MEPHIRVRLEKMLETTKTEGWQLLSEDLETKITMIKEELVSNLNVEQDVLKIAQGRTMSYRDILSLPIVLENALDEKDEADEPDSI